MGNKWISASKKQKVAEKFNYSCAYCGITLNSETLVVDHIKPRSQGGGNGIENLFPSCRSCNSTKGTKNLNEFRLLRSFRLAVPDVKFTYEQILFLDKKGLLDQLGVNKTHRFFFETFTGVNNEI